MKFTIATVILSFLAVGAVASPAELVPRRMPPCGSKCAKDAMVAGGCGASIACMCKAVHLHNSVAACIRSGCSAGDARNSAIESDKACAKAGVPTNLLGKYFG